MSEAMIRAEPQLHVDVLDDLDGLVGEWRALAERSDNFFATWEWLGAWWRHFGRDRALLVMRFRRADGSPVGLWPLYLARIGGLRVLRNVGHGPSDQLGPICAPSDQAAVAVAACSVLDDPPEPYDLLIADELPGGVAWADAVGARHLAEQPSPSVPLGGSTWEAWMAGRSSGLRAQLRRGERRLAQRGTVAGRVTAEPEQVATDLAELWRLHDARWRARGGSRSFTNRTAFHREVARTALADGRLRLRFLEVDGQPVAAVYNFRFGNAEYFYQAGRDPAFDDCSVGLLLHARAIRDCLGDGVREYRMLRGGESYKLRFADLGASLTTVARTRTAAGSAALRLVARQVGWSREVRRRVPAPLAFGTGGSPVWGPP